MKILIGILVIGMLFFCSCELASKTENNYPTISAGDSSVIVDGNGNVIGYVQANPTNSLPLESP